MMPLLNVELLTQCAVSTQEDATLLIDTAPVFISEPTVIITPQAKKRRLSLLPIEDEKARKKQSQQQRAALRREKAAGR